MSKTVDDQYLDFVEHVYLNGDVKSDRTGTGTKSVFGHQMRFNLAEEFPHLKAKFTPIRLVAVELLWLLSGNTNIKYLLDNNCHIWDEWADANGNLGPVYGEQWRAWPRITVNSSPRDTIEHLDGSVTNLDMKVHVETIDQIANLIRDLKNNPDSRRHIVSAWNVSQIKDMALPPCHAFFQFYVSTDNKLSCQLYQRSADLFLGVPFNISSYSLLTHMIAQVCDMEVGEFIWTGGDCHIYSNHYDQVVEMLSRERIYEKTQLVLDKSVKDIDAFTIDHIALTGYKYHPTIKAPVAV